MKKPEFVDHVSARERLHDEDSSRSYSRKIAGFARTVLKQGINCKPTDNIIQIASMTKLVTISAPAHGSTPQSCLSFKGFEADILEPKQISS